MKIQTYWLYKECYGIIVDVENFLKECTNDAWNPESQRRYYKQITKCAMGENLKQSVFILD